MTFDGVKKRRPGLQRVTVAPKKRGAGGVPPSSSRRGRRGPSFQRSLVGAGASSPVRLSACECCCFALLARCMPGRRGAMPPIFRRVNVRPLGRLVVSVWCRTRRRTVSEVVRLVARVRCGVPCRSPVALSFCCGCRCRMRGSGLRGRVCHNVCRAVSFCRNGPQDWSNRNGGVFHSQGLVVRSGCGQRTRRPSWCCSSSSTVGRRPVRAVWS